MIVNSNSLVIFIHIPKTGGTTLTNLILREYPNHFFYDVNKYDIYPKGVSPFKIEISKADCLWGHFLFGAHAYISQRPFTYITMMRDPIEQVLSYFFSTLRNPQHPEYNKFLNIDFKDYIDSEEFFTSTSNIQTRYISGNFVNPDLSLAKENINKYFSVVGLTEFFDDSVLLMKNKLYWGDIKYQKENVNTKRPLQSDFPKEIIDKIREKNLLDLELYQYVKQKMRSGI